jgi:hypothetical protein
MEQIEMSETARLLYATAWDQYKHEDDLQAQRLASFSQLNIGLLAFLGVFGNLVIALSKSSAGIASFCLFSAFVATAMIALLLAWLKRNHAARPYLNVRWACAYALESRHKVSMGAATLEHRWHLLSRRSPDQPTVKPFQAFDNFPSIDAIEDFALDRKPTGVSFGAIERVIWTLLAVWSVVLVGGLAACAFSNPIAAGLVPEKASRVIYNRPRNDQVSAAQKSAPARTGHLK